MRAITLDMGDWMTDRWAVDMSLGLSNPFCCQRERTSENGKGHGIWLGDSVIPLLTTYLTLGRRFMFDSAALRRRFAAMMRVRCDGGCR